MIIREITELSFDYANLDAKTVTFLKSNFKGAMALVADGTESKKVSVDELKEFDQLEALVDLPNSLKLAKVVSGLPQSLEKRGFLQFKVEIPPDIKDGGPAVHVDAKGQGLAVGSAEARKMHEIKKAKVLKFVDLLTPAEEGRSESTRVIEEMMDMGRAGKVTAKGAEAMVEEIVSQGTSAGMRAIAGLKGSDQTYAHCVDMSVILQECYGDIMERNERTIDEKTRRLTLLSGFMHDIGKSEIPKDVLESTVRFAPDSKEMTMMRNHTVYGAKILTDMGMPKATVNVAHYHHVKKDATMFTSYPDVPYDQVNSVTRLASIVDVYQALIGKRKYKKNWVPGAAVDYILGLSGSEFDERMVAHFLESMGKYPVGSLVRLSTGDLGFVLMIAPPEHPDRPIVAVVESGAGEILTHHTLMDLMLVQDVTVKEVVDHYEHYNRSEDQAYKMFMSIRLN
ncbi:MAG: HD domain-containing protein [Candidatus Lambdaproteobacteria bacterium]|nr:HD domain-containing protein [Candidatus Lambdaproteobacteria bacterium]